MVTMITNLTMRMEATQEITNERIKRVICSPELSPSELSAVSASSLFPPQAAKNKHAVRVKQNIFFIIPPISDVSTFTLQAGL